MICPTENLIEYDNVFCLYVNNHYNNLLNNDNYKTFFNNHIIIIDLLSSNEKEKDVNVKVLYGDEEDINKFKILINMANKPLEHLINGLTLILYDASHGKGSYNKFKDAESYNNIYSYIKNALGDNNG